MLTVIFSTYNSPGWLEKTLWGFHFQTFQDFEIIVADDGSTPETLARIKLFEQQSGRQVKHVWQADEGFRKTRILNKALLVAEGDYVVFTDGDCIPRNDFLATHVQYREPGYFLSGGYFKLPLSASRAITVDDIKNGNAFDVEWLVERGLKKTHKALKLTAFGTKSKLLNRLTPTRASWNGHNASGWLEDIIAVNGFDERMRYGGEDRELGERLLNKGIKSKQIRYSAVCVHLEHDRSYVEQEVRLINAKIIKNTKKNQIVATSYGLDRHTSFDSAEAV
ncbi:glycosyl transferase family 2 [Pseudidiomarina aestuarii]|uniref:Glycosyl transferase family 2 n=1 Tax=Pseudidiomarina aestuarii TaxID=624146 RepID=A0A7Z6ZSC2_9GAMM|nr:glycosyltransferase family 2 protein [Pseudidiomarina aestuarii]RUO39125.1 glycosyl transferase family 2 [Pseudidiomarina aestuarii]